MPFPVAAARAGLEPREAARLWRALGFPDPAEVEPRLPEDVVDALALMAVVSRELLGADATLGLARVLGAASSRVAQAVVDTFRMQFELPQRVSGTRYSDVVEAYLVLARDRLPAFLDAVSAVVKRHMVAAASGTWTADEDSSAPRRDLVVGFADLVGYSSLSRTLPPRQLAALIGRFETVVSEVVSGHRGQLVKLIGDGAMFVVDDAVDACRLGLDLAARFDTDDVTPPVRVGLAAGPVMSLFGDYFGETVNLAARLVALARPSTVVVSDDVRSRGADALAFERLPMQALKGFHAPTAAFRLIAAGSR